jgi:hypothetical protein
MLRTFDEFLPANADILGEQRFIADSGKVFGVNFVMNRLNDAWTKGHYATLLGVNTGLIQEVGCKDPRDYYDEGNWNWESFEEVCKAVNAASTESNQLWPLGGSHLGMMAAFIAANGGSVYDDINDTINVSSPETVAALNFYAKLLMEDKYIFVFEKNGVVDLWGDGNQYYFQGGKVALFNCVTWQVTSGSSGVSFDIGIVSYPYGPGYKGATWFRDMRGYAIPKTSPDPKSIYKIYEEYNTWFGDDSEWHETNWRDSTAKYFETMKDYDRLNIIGREEWAYDLAMAHFGGGFLAGILTDVFSGGTTVATSLESQKSLMEARIDELLGRAQPEE